MMKKILIAPDSFKGTFSALNICRILEEEIKTASPEAEVTAVPVADGGEGTAEAFLYAFGGEKINCCVKSPLGRSIDAYYVRLKDGTVVIESALASGLTLEKERDALCASSYGTGQLVKYALDSGARRIFIGIGGSAMTDGGTGFLAALGADFYDEGGNKLTPSGEMLERINSIDLSAFDRRVNGAEITVLCDVKNPLYGKNGAAYIFAPQKGATENEVRLLDRGLKNFARVSQDLLGKDYSSYEGAGAAGGLGFALVAYTGAVLKSGIDLVLDFAGFEEKAQKADIIITGEGKMDSQSLMGKVPFGVASRCKGKRVVAVVGVNEATEEECEKMGLSLVIETNPLHLPFEEIKPLAEKMLREAVKSLIFNI